MRKPNLFLVGGAKCGTTAMASYLSEHPNIFWSDPKELWFFCRKDLGGRNEPVMSVEDYLGYFACASDREQYLAEGSVSYLYAPNAVKEILDFNPDAKFLVMVRNPIDAAQSLHRQSIINMQESEVDFWRAWMLQDERRAGRMVPWKCQNYRYLLYRDWCLWGEQLERVFGVAGRDRVEVVVFDDFKKDPRAAYRKVLSFLGLEDDGRSDFPVVNQSRSYKNQWMINAFDTAVQLGVRMKRALGLGFPMRGEISRFLQRLRKSQEVVERRQELSDEVKRRLGDEFRLDIERLSRLLGRDFTPWIAGKDLAQMIGRVAFCHETD